MIMIILSARDSDKNINSLASKLFKEFNNMKALAISNVDILMKHIKKVSVSAT